jgi:hypothetical protein
LLINHQTKDTLQDPLLAGLSKANRALKLQIQNFLWDFETNFLSNLHSTMGQNFSNGVMGSLRLIL